MWNLQPKKEYTNGIHSQYMQLLYGDSYINFDDIGDIKVKMKDLEKAQQYLVRAIYDLSESDLANLKPSEYKEYLVKATEIREEWSPLPQK